MTVRTDSFNRALVALIATALLALLVSLIGPTTADATSASVQASKSCGLSAKEGRSLGATYVTSLSVKKVSCSKGKSVAKAFNACRRANGGAKGRCNSKVGGGYKCTESRNSIPSQISSKVNCKRGSKKVSFRFTQFT